ncbi:hypothetical protein DFH06DRAFT_1047401 [Mycena polygramma]|nr:hypothetical protein DFH06DRAFT_1047401 [Mycena polygramma]
MPPEILSEIFGWTLLSVRDTCRRQKSRITDSPWVFTHVSRRWRTVSVSNPSLWSLVVIAYHSHPSASYPVAMVETQISRAHTLKVHFHGYETSDTPQLEIFQSLAKHASRWEELSLTLTSFLVPLLADLRGCLPLLRRLWIQWADHTSQAAAESIRCFETAPSLVDIGVNNEFRFIPVSFPTQQLTRYELDAPSDIHRGMLKLCTNLREACITISFNNSRGSGPSEFIELLYLRRLYVSAPLALTFLKLPLLEEISMCLQPEEADNGLMNLQSLLMRSSCRIRKLCIEGCIDAPKAAEVLHKFPSIVDLAIIADTPAASATAGVLLDILDKQVSGSSVVAPQLRHLAFGCMHEGSLDYGRFSEVVKYRWEDSFCTLTSAVLCVGIDSGPGAAVLSDLNALREKGLDFAFLDGLNASGAVEESLFFAKWI